MLVSYAVISVRRAMLHKGLVSDYMAFRMVEDVRVTQVLFSNAQAFPPFSTSHTLHFYRHVFCCLKIAQFLVRSEGINNAINSAYLY